ncbi:wax ester/triacylglycerol synthase domain-containing protein [Nocardia wallacei]|uniref:wax ester/triacylglycerol synthase domain-containing protein n=1 Tax=Nocardia wallacei TaxID=480035 RepID=UPI003CC7EED7
MLDDAIAARRHARVLTRRPTGNPRAFWQLPPLDLDNTSRATTAASGYQGPLSARLRAAVDAARDVILRRKLPLPFEAPRTVFNVAIGAERRCEVRSVARERVERIRQQTGTTADGVILAVVAVPFAPTWASEAHCPTIRWSRCCPQR